MPWNKHWEYAMYKGEELLSMGTRDEICKEMNIKPRTFAFYRTKKYEERVKKRKNTCSKGYRTIIRIDGEDNDE